MGIDGCLKKGMDLSNTIQGGKVMMKNVFMGRKWKNSFHHFSLYKFLISFVKLKWLEQAKFKRKVNGVLDIYHLLIPHNTQGMGNFIIIDTWKSMTPEGSLNNYNHFVSNMFAKPRCVST
jgi:hypothetical protein